jgi:imidazolonepropionase-like amidohydrolase
MGVGEATETSVSRRQPRGSLEDRPGKLDRDIEASDAALLLHGLAQDRIGFQMSPHRLPLLPVVVGTAFLSVHAQAGARPGSSSTDGSLALSGGLIYVSPTEEPLHDGVVLIQGREIAAVGRRSSLKIPPNARVIDCSGLTITAGFWNSHVHFFERKWADAGALPADELARQLQDMLTRYGFTSVFDLGSSGENTRRIRDRIEAGEVSGPRVRSTGNGILPPGVAPSDQILNVLGFMKSTPLDVESASQAAAAARKLVDEGVDGIKVHSLPDEAVIRAAVDEGHRSGKPVFAHPARGDAGLLAAVRGGVDVLAHTTPQSGPWDETILTAMKERRVAVIPTLTIWRYLRRHDRLSVQEQATTTTTGQLRAWLSAGGTVLFGTDVGAIEPDPTEEYVLMAGGGMTFRQILASLTTAPAERFGESKRLGRVAAGLQADLVVLKDDPAGSVAALAAVRYTVRAGRVVYSARP